MKGSGLLIKGKSSAAVEYKVAAIKKAFCNEGFLLQIDHLLCFLLILVLEFLNTAGSIHKQLLASEKRVRSRTNFDLYNRVFLAIFPFDGFFSL